MGLGNLQRWEVGDRPRRLWRNLEGWGSVPRRRKRPRISESRVTPLQRDEAAKLSQKLMEKFWLSKMTTRVLQRILLQMHRSQRQVWRAWRHLWWSVAWKRLSFWSCLSRDQSFLIRNLDRAILDRVVVCVAVVFAKGWNQMCHRWRHRFRPDGKEQPKSKIEKNDAYGLFWPITKFTLFFSVKSSVNKLDNTKLEQKVW